MPGWYCIGSCFLLSNERLILFLALINANINDKTNRKQKENYMHLAKREDIAALMENIQKVGTVRSIVDNPEIRAEIARHGFALDELVDDPDPQVRLAVAQQGYGLDVLSEDTEWFVRAHVASRGYHLEQFLHDDAPLVRQTVAAQGYGLDTLVHDPDPAVRQTVAMQGYGLDILINDPEPMIKDLAQRLKEQQEG